MTRNRQILIPLFILTVGALGCSWFSGGSDTAELTFPATEVGVPVGEMIAKDIGPAGGSLASPDDRVTLTIPPNALAETVTFTIQPITNTAQGAEGPAYRFGPDGKIFSTPLEIKLKYDENDIKGTMPEALLLAFQSQNGEWQQLKTEKFDRTTNTLTVATTHFTDVALLAGFRINPVKATVFVGKSRGIEMLKCRNLTWIEMFRGVHWRQACAKYSFANWNLKGPGTLEAAFGAGPGGSTPGYLYTAPATRPNPNKAYVDVDVAFEVSDPTTGLVTAVKGKFTSEITIVSKGYRAKGQKGDIVFSGVICDLHKPFIVNASWLTPIGMKYDPAAGTWGFSTRYAVLAYEGSGTFTVEGEDTEHPRLAVFGTETLTHPHGGKTTQGGDNSIELIPLETDECK